jgi:hypothetical protein
MVSICGGGTGKRPGPPAADPGGWVAAWVTAATVRTAQPAQPAQHSRTAATASRNSRRNSQPQQLMLCCATVNAVQQPAQQRGNEAGKENRLKSRKRKSAGKGESCSKPVYFLLQHFIKCCNTIKSFVTAIAESVAIHLVLQKKKRNGINGLQHSKKCCTTKCLTFGHKKLPACITQSKVIFFIFSSLLFKPLHPLRKSQLPRFCSNRQENCCNTTCCIVVDFHLPCNWGPVGFSLAATFRKV